MCLSMPLQFCHGQEDLLALTNGKHWADQQSEVFKRCITVHFTDMQTIHNWRGNIEKNPLTLISITLLTIIMTSTTTSG